MGGGARPLGGGEQEKFRGEEHEFFGTKRSGDERERMAPADESAGHLAASAPVAERVVEGFEGHSLGPVGRITER